MLKLEKGKVVSCSQPVMVGTGGPTYATYASGRLFLVLAVNEAGVVVFQSLDEPVSRFLFYPVDMKMFATHFTEATHADLRQAARKALS